MNIGIVGKLGSGKTFAANHIIDKYSFERISLATPIKDIMAKYLNITDKTDPRYRQVAQFIGTDTFRKVDPDVWINYMIKTANEDYLSDYVCDDVRFENEATKLLENDWVLIYLNCPDHIRIERCKQRDGVFDMNTLNHPSETGVDDILKKYSNDIYHIDSSMSIKDTNNELDDLLDTLL